MTIKSF